MGWKIARPRTYEIGLLCFGTTSRPWPIELRGIEQGAEVARPSSAPERPVAAQAAVKAHKAGAAKSIPSQK